MGWVREGVNLVQALQLASALEDEVLADKLRVGR
jgi:hypothetical protein